MRRFGRVFLATVLLAAPACALDTADRADAVAFLAEQIDTALTQAEPLSVWVDVLGQRKSYPVAAVDAKALTVKLGQNLFPLRWSDLKAEDLASIAKSIAGDKGERLVVAAEVALLLGFPDRANEWLGQIRDPDEALKLKIRHVVQRIAETRAPAPVAPVPEKKAEPATPPASPTPPPGVSQPVIVGPVINVGPTRANKTIAGALAKAKAGETVLVDPGTYNEVFKMRNRGQPNAPVTLRGLRGPNGERPLLDATGVSVSGVGPTPRAIIQVEGEYCVVEGLEFKNARNGNNGSGLRFVGCTNAIARDCKITYCDMGMMGGDKETLRVERCEVAFNGTKDYDGYSHNFYMLGNRTVIRECHIHDSLFGQNFKTRGHYTELWYNFICDSEEGELGFVDSDDSVPPNSHAVLVGNVVVSKPNRRGNPSKFIDFGGEGKGRGGNLFLFNNTLVAGTPRVQFVHLAEQANELVAYNNIFQGSGKPPDVVSGKMRGSNNFFSGGALAAFTNTVKGGRPLFADAAARDFRLQPGSPCLNSGAPEEALSYTDGDGKTQKVVLDQQATGPLKCVPRPKKPAADIGALSAP